MCDTLVTQLARTLDRFRPNVDGVLLDLFFPPCCAGCGASSVSAGAADGLLCAFCRGSGAGSGSSRPGASSAARQRPGRFHAAAKCTGRRLAFMPGPGRRSPTQGRAAFHPRVEGARSPPRRRSGCRAHGRAPDEAGSRRHRVYPAGRRPLPDPGPPPGRASRATPRARLGDSTRLRCSPADGRSSGRPALLCAERRRNVLRRIPGRRGAVGRRGLRLWTTSTRPGATCGAAASALRAGGARHIEVIDVRPCRALG